MKAQEEIDRVISADRLPTSEDEPKLPYVIVLAKEVFRWQQVTPFGTRPFILAFVELTLLSCISVIPHC